MENVTARFWSVTCVYAIPERDEQPNCINAQLNSTVAVQSFRSMSISCPFNTKVHPKML